MKTIKKTFSTAVLMVAAACLAFVPNAAADQVILDDLIVDGSACIGFDCVNGESFGFDTIRIKENNLRIKAQDTSSTASFPSNDWQLTFNDSANGGANKFSVDDIDGGRTPFTIEAGAPSHSLYVDDGGRLGFGTNTPVVDLHIKSGNTPTLRLEQDGSSGFTPQTWDVAGNEAGFFVRDATNGSTLPFRIRPGAPSSAIEIAADGDVGFGALPIGANDGQLHIQKSTAPFISLEKTGTGAGVWFFTHENNSPNDFLISKNLSGFAIRLTEAGNLTVNGDLTVNGAGMCTGCDGVFEPGYQIESIEQHAASMWENSYLPAIGPTPDGKQVPLSLGKRHFGVLNELEKAHIYIDQLNAKLEDKAAQMDELNERMARLEAALLGSN